MRSQQKRRSSPRAGPPDPILVAEALGWPGHASWGMREPGEGQASQRMARKGSVREGAGEGPLRVLQRAGLRVCLCKGPTPPTSSHTCSGSPQGPRAPHVVSHTLWLSAGAPRPPGHHTHTLACDARRAGLTSHLPRRPVSCSRDQMLWIRPACSGWLLVFPQVHWCFSISVSYTRPAAGEAAVAAVRGALGVPGSWSPCQGS